MGIHHRAVVLGETLLYSTCTLCKQVSSPRYARRAEGASQPQGLVLFRTYPTLATWMEMNVGGHHFCPEALLASREKKNHGELSDVWSFRHDSLGKRPNVPFGVICWYPPAPTPHQAGGGEVRCCCVVFREGEESGGTSHSSLTDRLLDTPQGV